jgi:hypothetical protein
MFHLAVVYEESGKRYVIPFEIVEKFVDKEAIERIKTEALKEIQKAT